MQNEPTALIELWIVQNSNPSRLVIDHSLIIIHLNWIISLLFNPLILVRTVSIMLHHSHWLVWLIGWFEFTDLPQLQSVIFGERAFTYVHSVVFESEWLNGWIDDSDLPQLQSIQLGDSALDGDAGDNRKTIEDEPYNYKNTLTMRSEIERVDEWADLPSLTSFNGYDDIFGYIGSVILESSYLVIESCRYPSVVIRRNPIQWWLLLLVHPFPPILKYAFSHLIITRCSCSWISHQNQKSVAFS